MRLRARRRSVSICVSPGPLVPIPPPSRSRWLHSPRMRARLYSSCASSTCSVGAALHELADDRYACRSQQLAELGDIIALAQRAYAKSSLARAARALRLALSPLDAARCGRERTAAIAASLHPAPSLVAS